MPAIDLHLHSNYSDGKMSIEELASKIKENKLEYCALTDHNTVAGVASLKKYLENYKVTVIPGVELTALFEENEIHILAYDFDVDEVEKILEERNSLVKKQKIEEMQRAKELFIKNGLFISDNLEPSEKKPVGYTLATDICSNQANQNIFLERHGKTLNPDDVYFEYQAPGKACAVTRSGVSVSWLINKLKGKVSDFVIAHPFLRTSFVTKPLSENDIISLLKIGVNGLEIYHDKTADNKVQWLNKITSDNNLSYTGGSDFHNCQNNPDIGFYGKNLEVPSFRLSNFKQETKN